MSDGVGVRGIGLLPFCFFVALDGRLMGEGEAGGGRLTRDEAREGYGWEQGRRRDVLRRYERYAAWPLLMREWRLGLVGDDRGGVGQHWCDIHSVTDYCK